MSQLCVVEGCPGSTRRKKRGEKIYYFKALEDQVEAWSRVIPGNYKLQLHDRVCSRHFKDEDLMKEWNFIIDDKMVTMPRGRWTLRVGAIPEKFDNYEDDIRVSLKRKSKPKSLVELDGSSSDADHVKPRRKRAKKSKRTGSKGLKNSEKTSQKNINSDSKSCSNQSLEEPCRPSSNHATEAEVSWEKACDSFVDQLISICTPTPTDKSDAKHAKRRQSRRLRPEGSTPPKEERRPVGRPHKEERRPVGRPGKEERMPVGRPKNDKLNSISSSRNTSRKRTTRANRTFSTYSGGNSEIESSVVVEEFVAVASSCDDSVDVDIISDPDSSSQITITECLLPPRTRVKTERSDEGGSNNNSSSTVNYPMDTISVASSSQGCPLRHRIVQENYLNYERVVVKREMCDCEGGDSRCCETEANRDETCFVLPDTPIPHEENSHTLLEQDNESCRGPNLPCVDSEIDQNGWISVVEVMSVPQDVNEVDLRSEYASSSVNSEPILEFPFDSKDQDTHDFVTNEAHKKTTNSGTQGVTTVQCDLSRTSSTQNPSEKQASRKTTVVRENPSLTLNNGERFEDNSDLEINFAGFASDEEDEVVMKMKYFQDTAEMASRSTALYFSKLAKASQSKSLTPVSEKTELSPRSKRPTRREQRSNVEIAIDQLNNLETMLPVRSTKPRDHKNKSVVEDSGGKIQGPSVHDGNLMNKDGSFNETLSTDLKCDEVLKSGRISNEVTVTKTSNSHRQLDKASIHGMEKVPPRFDRNIQPTDNLNLKSCSPVQSSNGRLIMNKINTPSNTGGGGLENEVPTSSNLLKDKVTASLSCHPVKDKVTISSNHELPWNKGTPTLRRPLNDKIPTTISEGTDPLKFSQSPLFNGSSLDRIVESTKSSKLLDSAASASMCDPTVDKTSLILKNFKSDGVLALECVVLKEQVRQLQKELFLHKQMLIDSEHNASLLQRKLELQAQLPCVKCVNFKRGFIGKETLI